MPPPGRRAVPALLLLVASCGGGEGDAADAAERAPAPDGPDAPVRVVSLVPAATATLLALGAGDRLVGRTDFDTAAAVAHLPSVGGGLRPSAEVLLSLRPDVVIRFEGETDPGTPALLDEAGVRHVAVRPERIEDAAAMIRTLGRLVGREDAADSIVAVHRAVLDSIRVATADLEPVRVAFTLGGETPWVAGPRTFVGELLEAAGGMNVFGDLERPWAGVGPETFLDRDPDVVLAPEGARLDPRLSAGRDVRTVPPFVQVPGPDLDRAARAVARALRTP